MKGYPLEQRPGRPADVDDTQCVPTESDVDDEDVEPDADDVPDQIRLVTVGIDIGSATTHFLLSRITLRRLGVALMSRFEVVAKEELYRSGILLTPYRSATEIDAGALERFFAESFVVSGVGYEELDTGIVMLTGEAARKANARAIATLFAASMGKFVCSSAGHHLEARMAANGSGAVLSSRERSSSLVNVDVGGGTTKFTLVDSGEIVGTAALNVGGRLVAIEGGVVARIDDAARRAAAACGVELVLGQALADVDVQRLCATLAGCVVEYLTVAPEQFSVLTRELLLTEPLAGLPAVSEIVMSGGVSEYLGRPDAPAKDLGPRLAAELLERAGTAGRRVTAAPEGIRATVVGLSQFTTQLSGDTVFVSSPAATPQMNLPVVTVSLLGVSDEVSAEQVAAVVRQAVVESGRADLLDPVAISLLWDGRPYFRTLTAIAQGVAQVAQDSLPDGALVVTLTQDCARSLGAALQQAVAGRCEVVCVDGLSLSEHDFIDIGAPIQNGRVLPVVVKTLVFPEVTRADDGAEPLAAGRYAEVGGQLL
jgi:ethanolamine utilization protein EutA